MPLGVCTKVKTRGFQSLFYFPSPLSVPLERGTSEVFRQREARAARLASEIESSPQYRRRVSLENDEGKSEEDKYSSVLRDGSDRERDHESPRERGRDSPGASSRWDRQITRSYICLAVEELFFGKAEQTNHFWNFKAQKSNKCQTLQIFLIFIYVIFLLVVYYMSSSCVWWTLCLSERESTFHYLSVRERWTERELREVLVGLRQTIVSAEVTALLHPHLHPQDPHSPLLGDLSLEFLHQREAALCQVEAGPMLPTTHRVATAQVLVPQARTRLPLLVDPHPRQPLLLMPPPHPAPLPLMDMQSLILNHFLSLCRTLADPSMGVSYLPGIVLAASSHVHKN